MLGKAGLILSEDVWLKCISVHTCISQPSEHLSAHRRLSMTYLWPKLNQRSFVNTCNARVYLHIAWSQIMLLYMKQTCLTFHRIYKKIYIILTKITIYVQNTNYYSAVARSTFMQCFKKHFQYQKPTATNRKYWNTISRWLSARLQ